MHVSFEAQNLFENTLMLQIANFVCLGDKKVPTSRVNSTVSSLAQANLSVSLCTGHMYMFTPTNSF